MPEGVPRLQRRCRLCAATVVAAIGTTGIFAARAFAVAIAAGADWRSIRPPPRHLEFQAPSPASAGPGGVAWQHRGATARSSLPKGKYLKQEIRRQRNLPKFNYNQFRADQWVQSRYGVPTSSLPVGKRREKLLRLKEAITEAIELNRDDPDKPSGFQTGNRKQKWENVMKEDRRLDLGYAKQGKILQEIILWLPIVLGPSFYNKEDELLAEDFAELFVAFVPDEAKELRETLSQALPKALQAASLNETSTVIEGMAIAGVPHVQTWKNLGVEAMHRLTLPDGPSAPTLGEISALAWAISTAEEELEPEYYTALKDGLRALLHSVPTSRLQALGWGCAEVGLDLSEFVGTPSFSSPPEAARVAWAALARLGDDEHAETLSIHPVPIVAWPEAVSPEHAAQLLRLADKDNLWKPSVRSAGTPVVGRPWSALLSRPEHRAHPAVEAVRRWVARMVDVPVERVENPRIVRYRPGERSGPAFADARPPGDASLWLSGQRTMTVLISLSDLIMGAGGETIFPSLDNLTLRPELGTALIWPTVTPEGKPEARAARAALPFVSVATEDDATKYTLTTWVRSGPAPGEAGAPAL